VIPVDYVYCLNLDFRKDKFEKVIQQFKNVNIQPSRFSAVTGDNLNYTPNKNFKSKGALACILSHINIIEDAISKNYKKIAVFEDDVVFSKNFNLEILKNLTNWKLIYLGASQVRWDNIIIKNGYYHPNDTLGTWAMLIDCSVYNRILEAYKKFEATADLTLAKEFKNDPDCYVIYPNLCITDVSSSDIRNYKVDQESFNKKCKWDLDSYNFHQIN